MAAPKGNNYAIGNNGGRPPLYSDPETLAQTVDEYFKDNPKVTISGLALYLGFESRQSFYDYEEKEEFSYIVKRSRLFVEMTYEERLAGNNCTGSIFALKNMGWKDKTEVDNRFPDGVRVKHVYQEGNDPLDE
jgi:hypothetical protein